MINETDMHPKTFLVMPHGEHVHGGWLLSMPVLTTTWKCCVQDLRSRRLVVVVDVVGLPGGVGQPYRAGWLDMLALEHSKV